MKRTSLSLSVVLLLLLTTGCWDRKELNDRAPLLGWGMDLVKDGTYRATAQLAISSKLGGGQGPTGQEYPYFIETGFGKNIRNAADDIQTKISRTLFAGHRRAIIIGESLARHGLKEIVDEYSRNVIVRLRSDMFIVKGGTATELLRLTYPYERIPIFGAVKIHEAGGIKPEFTLRDFLIAASSEGSSPVLPVLEILPEPPAPKGPKGEQAREPRIKHTGTGVFNSNLKLVGFLDAKDSSMREWVCGIRNSVSIAESLPEIGNISLDVYQLRSKITPVIQDNKVLKVNIIMTGNGSLVESNTNLDLSESNNLIRMQDELSKQLEESTMKMIKKAQHTHGRDVFGIDNVIHRKHPYLWKTLKIRWDKEFANVDVSVKVNLVIRDTGQLGKPLQLKKNEIQ
ncbi:MULTISPECIES: Ger(x)C family spore germination protein [unclassified Paenibacillus]|uniref:Ger(x)C family spore germination protein n=1 Tax=unclassified Paenibacillus TaxID=185978 RepID=UPI00362F35C0